MKKNDLQTIYTWLFKLGGRLDKQHDEIVEALSDINAFNAGKKRDKALALLSAWLPDMENRSNYSPKSFTGPVHLLRARAVEKETLSRRNLALNPYDRHDTAPEDTSEDKAICAMADALYSFDLLANGEGGPVQSASIGSVSVSYGGAAAQSIDLSPRGQEKELYRCACRYLDIYRGVGGCG